MCCQAAATSTLKIATCTKQYITYKPNGFVVLCQQLYKYCH